MHMRSQFDRYQSFLGFSCPICLSSILIKDKNTFQRINAIAVRIMSVHFVLTGCWTESYQGLHSVSQICASCSHFGTSNKGVF